MPSTVRALAFSTHPGPTVAVTTITVVLGIGVGLDPIRLVLLGVAFFFDQVSVGLSNDWLDAGRDRTSGRLDKPVALGWVSARLVRNCAFTAAGLALVLTVPLGLPATITHAVFLTSAWAYNLGLKSTLASVLPYIVSFGLLPLIVTLALAQPRLVAPWAMGMGALLGIAAHFANVAPDLDDDRITGVRGLPHALGARGGPVVTFLALAAASALTVVGPGITPFVAQWMGLGATLAIAAFGIVLATIRAPGRLQFRLVLLAAVIDVVLLATSGERLFR